jgi:arylsulfatase A-like enzyme
MLSRRHFFLGCFAGAALRFPALGAKKPAERVNVLFLTADYLPSWVLGAYGNGEIHTPNLDRLAQMGTRFSRHLVCAPEPEQNLQVLLTGRTPRQLNGGAPSDVPTLAGLLRAAGYSCHTAHAAGAVQLLDGQGLGKPFFLHVHFDRLRPPYSSLPQRCLDLYAGANFQSFGREAAAQNAAQGKELLSDRIVHQRQAAAAITALDEEVQSVLAPLAARKLLDTTVIVFTGTCGALLGRHGLWGAGEGSDPVNMYRESVETPLIWVWPGKVPAQAVRPELVSSYDCMPSLCEMLLLPAPGGNLCGRSYAPLAMGKPLPKKMPWRGAVFGDWRGTGMACVERYKLVWRDQGHGELYDLKADPGENSNQYDNPQFLTIRNELASELADWRRRYSS